VAGGNDLAMVAYSQWGSVLDGMEYARFENRKCAALHQRLERMEAGATHAAARKGRLKQSGG